MKLSEMRKQSFPDYEFDEWKKTAEDSLKGKPLESLQRPTYENIILKPLYTSEVNQSLSQYPGADDYRRGNDSLGYVTNNWKVAQRISYSDLEELKEKLKLALESGQSVLSFEVSKEIMERKGFLGELIKTYGDRYPLALEPGGFQGEVLAELEKVAKTADVSTKIAGYAVADPLAAVVINGAVPDDFDIKLEEFSKIVGEAGKKFPDLRTVLVDTTAYHNGGANAVQELGIAAATGVFYLNSLTALPTEQIINKLIFKVSIGSNYFMEIAKLRAARIIWKKVAECYRVSKDFKGMQIAAETSMFTKTVFDPYVNLLRGGNEAFAAVVGGVQYLHVHAFDQITGTNAFSERIARNTQLILQEEAHLQKVIDPAGGAWYIENLTNELAQKAWAQFQEIEAKGGMLEALKSGWLQGQIAEVYEKRKLDIFTRKQSIIGTNVYANLADAVPENSAFRMADEQQEGMSIDIMPIPQSRLSQPYEELRERAHELTKKSGSEPCVGLVCLGSLKQHKARMDFVRGFLSAGGISIKASQPIHSTEEALEFIKGSDTKHFCICGSNEQYQLLGVEILQAIQAKMADRTIYLSGLPEKEEQEKWSENGLKQFIHIKSNCFETLSSILSEMEVSVNEQIQA